MRWAKLGLVGLPPGRRWAHSHAMVPTPVRLDARTIRVYSTFLDATGIGRTGFVDLDAADPTRVLGVSSAPALDIGQPGCFDENGVVACSVLRLEDGSWRMYYVGFELGTRIRYRLLTGVAQSRDGGVTFTRLSRAPVLERSDQELYFRGGPFCLQQGGRFRLWYVAGSQWLSVDDKPMPVYDLRYAESNDGLHWPPVGRLVLPIDGPDEHGFGRPWVLPRADGGYRLFYSIRRKSLRAYRLGYAESEDGLHWERQDARLNLDVTPGGFDAQAIMYLAPIDVDGTLYAFYNGDDFGRAGFAVARLEHG